jgi:hypothetical protein
MRRRSVLCGLLAGAFGGPLEHPPEARAGGLALNTVARLVEAGR